MSRPNLPDDLGSMLAALERRVRILESANRLTNASIREGSLEVRSAPGTQSVIIGKLPNASYGIEILGGGGITVDGGPVRALDVDVEADQVANVSVTTTLTVKASVSIPVPSWVQKVLALGVMFFQMTNDSGVTQIQQGRIDIDGSPGTGGFSQRVEIGATQIMTIPRTQTIVSPGSTVTFEAVVAVNTSTNGSNVIEVDGCAFFLR